MCVCVCGGGGGVEQQLVDMMEICRFITPAHVLRRTEH